MDGESGLDIKGLMNRLETLDPAQAPDIILISIGVNDVTGLSSTKSWRQNVGQLLDRMQDNWPEALLVFTGLPPMARFPLSLQPLCFSLGVRAAIFDISVSELVAGRHKVCHVLTLIDPHEHDFCEDGFHPSAASNRIWAKALVKTIASKLTHGRLPLMPIPTKPLQ